MQLLAPAIVMFSVLFPSKTWYAPDQPLNVLVRGGGDVTLILTDFAGKPIAPDGSAQVGEGQTVDLLQLWARLRTPGTYLLFAVPAGKDQPDDFIGTPLVIGVREDRRREAPPGPMVVKVEPLQYAVLKTDKGDMTLAFYYDVAPNTVANFLSLAQGGYYDGLTFHRVVADFVIQGGDPRGDGTGGPGYTIVAEFSNREHREGVLSMARQGDPMERQGAMPRSEFANSAGSQFFICLNYQNTRQLDGRYTAFGQVVEGMETVQEIARATTDPQTERPTEPQVIRSIRVLSVTPQNNPYARMLGMERAASTQPAAP